MTATKITIIPKKKVNEKLPPGIDPIKKTD
jgi:hypothetical protein